MKRSERRMKVMAAGVMLAVGSAASAQCEYAWSILDVPSVPRTDEAMTYDRARGEALIFGGWETLETISGETRVLGPNGWQVKAATGPGPRWGARMVYHEGMGKVILHGGWLAQTTPFGDTFTWDGTAWTPLTSGLPRTMHAMAYDSDRQRIVLHGGVWASDTHTWYSSGETWELIAPGWTPVSSSGPSRRILHAMAYDKGLHRTVLFGGGDQGTLNNETWEWDGAAWTRKFPAVSPAARARHLMVYHEAIGKTIMWGGQGVAGSPLLDMWEWDGTNWTEIRGSGGAATSFSGGAYNPTDGTILMHGGRTGSQPQGDTWVWERRLVADLNRDGIVDFSDYLDFLTLFDRESADVDFNGDGMVDFADYLIFLDHFSQGC